MIVRYNDVTTLPMHAVTHGMTAVFIELIGTTDCDHIVIVTDEMAFDTFATN